MSKLEKLIKEKCKNGVEYIALGELIDYIQSSKYIVKKAKYNDDYDIPVLTAGKTFLLGYTNEHDNVFLASKENPVIIFDDFTTSSKWVDFNFKVKSSAMKILKVREDKKEKVNIRYVYYCMKSIKYTPIEHARQWIKTYSTFEIPVPKVEVQEEIVSILDSFNAYNEEIISLLQKENELRKEQYEYYRDRLLDFKDDKNIKWYTIGDIGKICMCRRIMKKQTTKSGDIPFYKIGTFGKKADSFISKELYEEYKRKYSFPKKGQILISASGTIGRTVIYDGEPAYFQDSNIVWVDNDEQIITNRFLKYLYEVIDWEIEGGTIKRLYNDKLAKTKIPVPSIETQEKIVSILDAFSKLTEDITCGLPAEIEMRKMQYEYYRDRLLDFD